MNTEQAKAYQIGYADKIPREDVGSNPDIRELTAAHATFTVASGKARAGIYRAYIRGRTAAACEAALSTPEK